MHRLFITLLSINILFVGIMGIYTNTQNFNVYADSIPSGYSPAGASDQVDAFRSYCKSRNLAIEGSVLDAVTSVTTSLYQKAVEAAGLDINELQNDIYKGTGENANNFYFTALGISAMNRIFAEFLQNEDLEVGDDVNNKNLYNGAVFTDSDGIGCLVSTITGNGYQIPSNVQQGGTYKYSTDEIYTYFQNNLTTESSYYCTFGLDDTNTIVSTNVYRYLTSGSISRITGHQFASSNSNYIYKWLYGTYADGYFTILKQNESYYCAILSIRKSDGYISISKVGTRPLISNSNNPVVNANVYITTNNTTINNNTYEGDTIIKPNGETTQPKPKPEDPSSEKPTWGEQNQGGESVWNTNGDGELNFPKINLPDLNIDWSLKNILHKFPFCIPFDIVALVGIFDAEPTAPHFQGDIQLGNITTWHYDFDFSVADYLATFVRMVEFIGFIFALIYITIHMVKG